MKVIIQLSFLVLLVVFYIVFFHPELILAKPNSIELEVYLAESESSILLQARLTNNGKMLFPVHSGFLPWNSYLIFQVVVIPVIQKNDNIVYQDLIKPILPIADPVSTVKLIFPWETLEGHIALREYFSSKTMDLFQTKNVLICWGYPLYRYGDLKFHWNQGYVISQKQESEKLLISETLDAMFQEKCSTVFVRIPAKYK